MRHSRWRWKLLKLFPASVVPDPDDELQMAVFTAHLIEDEIERQRERYDDAVRLHNALADLRASHSALDERRALLWDGPREQGLYEHLKADPVTRKAVVPREVLLADRAAMRRRSREG